MAAGQLDFDDLSSPEGRAEAAALERRIGPRTVPNTRIDIGKIDTTDGTIRFKVGRVVSAQGASPITSLSGRMTMDHQLLTIGDIRMALREGVVRGGAVIDQRGGRSVPQLSLNLRLSGASVLSLAGQTPITGGRGACQARRQRRDGPRGDRPLQRADRAGRRQWHTARSLCGGFGIRCGRGVHGR